jgi:hypothetical protein
MPWNEQYQKWVTDQYRLQQKRDTGRLTPYEHAVFLEWQRYRKVLLNPNASPTKRFNAWKFYTRRIMQINDRFGLIPKDKIQPKNTQQYILDTALDFETQHYDLR